jgi:rare lipoprotein A
MPASQGQSPAAQGGCRLKAARDAPTKQMMASTRVRPVLAAVLCLVLTGCTGTALATGSEPRLAAADLPAPVSHPAVAIATRTSAPGGVPALVGQPAARAEDRLRAIGAQPQLVAIGEGSRVSAQFPDAGQPLPGDGVVILWVGEPPAPPPPPAPEPEPAVAVPAAPPVAAPVEEPPPAPAPAPAPTAVVPVPGAGATPGLVPPPGPHPPRTSPRVLPALAAGTVLEGPASWYGPGFAGRTTACGGVFDPAQLTLATRELRCGTRVLVTGPSGASVEAVATDWGPAEWTKRRFDLSQATFAAIHPPGAGVISVTVEILAR